MGDLNLASGLVRYGWSDKGLKIRPVHDDLCLSGFQVPRVLPVTWYRNLPEQYVDEFLSQGRLRLSSFEVCADSEDSIRRDVSEGVCGISVTDGRSTVEIFLRVGLNPLLLCFSESLESYHKYNSYLKVNDPQGLGEAITSALMAKGFKLREVACGRCEYNDRLIIQQIPTGMLAYENMFKMAGRGVADYLEIESFIKTFAGNRLYFMKPAHCEIEQELRMMWDCDCPNEVRYVDLTIDNPRKYCEKVLV